MIEMRPTVTSQSPAKWESYEQEQWYKPRDEQYQTQEIFTKQGGFYIFSKYRTLKSGLGR